jgi:hypothetical protein
MNPQEQKTLEVISAHRQRVFNLMSRLSQEVMRRGNDHDESKLGPEELPHYIATIDEFEQHAYGSDGYHKAKESLGPAVLHHYKHNRHHPEHFGGDIGKMNLVDLLEMLADWKSATQNHPEKPGNMAKSISLAVDKYKISPELSRILYNTAIDFGMI